MRLQREMDQKSAKVFGLSHLGSRTRKVEVKALPTFPSLRDCPTAFKISCFTKLNKKMKNSIDQPLGPGLLSFLKLFKAVSISYKETSATMQSESSVERKEGKCLITYNWSEMSALPSSIKSEEKCSSPSS